MDGYSSLDGCFLSAFLQTCCHLLYKLLTKVTTLTPLF